MEKAVFGMDYLNISQGMNGSFSHQGTLALDVCGKDTGIDNFRAPFTGTIKRIYNGYCVWLESNEKVKYADGTEDYMTVLTMHDNDTSDLYVGKVIKQGQVYFQEGTKGYATGNHIHIAVGRGKYTGSGWYQNSDGNWCINNQYSTPQALFLLNSCIRKNDYGYSWITTDSYTYNSPKKTTDEIAQEIIGGKWGNGSDRKTRITNAGYNYSIVQARVNEILANKTTKKYLNLKPTVSSWTVYKTNNYYIPTRTSDVAGKLNPQKFGGLSYEILQDCGNYHFKIKTQNFGTVYIAGNPYKYSCTITGTPTY